MIDFRPVIKRIKDSSMEEMEICTEIAGHSQGGSPFIRPWYLIKTKPGQEERALANLTRIGIEAIYPRISERTPLFPGYLFGSVTPQLFCKADNAFGVRKIVRFGSLPAEVPGVVIEELRKRMNSSGCVEMSAQFNNGDHVTVIAGPLRGFHGVFDRQISGSDRVRILLNAVGLTHAEVAKSDLIAL